MSAQLLVRQVVRAFHPTPEVLAIEALVMHSCLAEADLAYLVGMNIKDLRKMIAPLTRQRYVFCSSRPEQVPDKPRPVNRAYYFIDYRASVDSIRWRYHKTNRDMQQLGSQGSAAAETEAKDYYCPNCKREYNTFDVMGAQSELGLICTRCPDGIVLQKTEERASESHKETALMNNQFQFMLELLQQIDAEGVPECSFEKALASARPIVRAAGNQVTASVPVDMAKLTAVKGLTDTGPKTISVQITDGNEEHAFAEESRRRKAQAEANALPAWITDSSVSISSSTTLGHTRKLSFEDENPAKKVKLEVNGGGDDDEDEEDDDDFEFEDVV